MSWASSSYTEEKHGYFVAYAINCCAQEGHCTSIFEQDNRTHIKMEGFLPFTTYNCCISLQTTLANSTEVCQEQMTLEDGNISYEIC